MNQGTWTKVFIKFSLFPQIQIDGNRANLMLKQVKNWQKSGNINQIWDKIGVIFYGGTAEPGLKLRIF